MAREQTSARSREHHDGVLPAEVMAAHVGDRGKLPEQRSQSTAEQNRREEGAMGQSRKALSGPGLSLHFILSIMPGQPHVEHRASPSEVI